MKIIGCDFHTRYQQIAMMKESTGELLERRLDHQSGEAEGFYRQLQGPVRVGIEATGELMERRLDHESGEAHAFYRDLQGPVRVGIEATGPIRWFERLLAELGHELWIGDSAKIRASEVRKQKLWALSDLIRDRLKELGVTIEDAKDGTSWRWG